MVKSKFYLIKVTLGLKFTRSNYNNNSTFHSLSSFIFALWKKSQIPALVNRPFAFSIPKLFNTRVSSTLIIQNSLLL